MFIVRLEANVRTRNLLFLIFRLMSNCPTTFLRFGIKAKLRETIRIKYKFLVKSRLDYWLPEIIETKNVKLTNLFSPF